MMQKLGGNRISETISDELLDTDARMSDMSNLTTGNSNFVAQLNNHAAASPNMMEVGRSPFTQQRN